ncbi:MAG: MFS transporter [Firmicutes bacterium HGW-Firmicutes-11]|jgi:EmrB/QacA subfamily drug resistance transporter|nr:MAG: MFS transporter [Firmicutes bacterium HGW-Firmicutes-11]
MVSKFRSPDNKVLLVLFLGVLMGALDIAIVGPALTPIKDYFGAASRDMTWVFSIYILMNLVGTPIIAKLSDMNGRKKMYIASILLFSAGSLVVASAPSLSIVILGRAIQGFGAGGIFPVASAVIGDMFPPEKRGRALGLIGAVFGIAFIVGPVVGGVLLMISWQAIFLVNLPIAVLLLYLAVKYIPSSSPRKKVPFDWAGMIVLSIMLGSFVFGVNQLDTTDLISSIVSTKVLPYLVASILLLFFLIAIEKRSVNPIITPILFGSRQLKISHTLAFGAGFCEVSLVYLPMLAVASFSISPSGSSFMLIPSVLALSVGAPTFGRLLDKIGSKKVINFGTACLTVGMLLLAAFVSNWTMFFISTVIVGFGLSALLGAPIRYILLNETNEQHRGSAQGLMTIFTSTGQLISAAVIGAIIGSATNPVAGFSTAYLIIGVFSLALVLVSTRLKPK